MQADVSVIIVNYNTRELVRECIESLYRFIKGVCFEIIVVDNASADGSAEMIRKTFPDVRLIENNINKGFGSANNTGAKAASGRYLFLFNSDAVLESDTACSLVDYLEKDSQCAMAGPEVRLLDRSRQPKICGELPSIPKIICDTFYLSTIFPGVSFFQGMHTDKPLKRITQTGWVSGVCMMIRKDVFEEIRGFDETIFLYCEDIDLCSRIREKGWKIIHIEDYPVIHKCGGSAKSDNAVIRNSELHQKYFLGMLKKKYGPFHMEFIRLIMLTGLILRVFAGIAQKAVNRKQPSLLLETSMARIKSLICG